MSVAETMAKGHEHGNVIVPEQSRAERLTSFRVEDFPMPTGREEEWRFTPLKRMQPVLTETATQDEGSDYAAEYDVDAPAEIIREPLAPGQAPRGNVLVPGDRAAVVADAGCSEALHIKLPDNFEAAEPIRITVTGKAGRRSNAHYVLEFGANSRATVVLLHRGSGFHTGNLETIVGDGATATVVTLQEWADDAVHAGQHDARVGRDGTYKHVAVTLGGGAVRLNANVDYAGPGGDAELLGVYFADAGQHLEHRSLIDHNQPKCRSLATYKGALQGETAHTVWVGDVLIREVAEGTDTYELNRNLILTKGARADSVPNLEIETGEIEGAGHASATGRFDEEQLFYLQSRGIPEVEARRLVVRGFFADVIARIGVPDVVERLMEAIERELAASDVSDTSTGSAAPVGAEPGAGA